VLKFGGCFSGVARTAGRLERPGSLVPAELTALRMRLTWLQLLYSLAADILHAHGAISIPPEA
jgi:hypothetical protein